MFNANGTEGLELFTWIVAGIGGLIAALVFTNFLTVNKEENVDEEIDGEDHKETIA